MASHVIQIDRQQCVSGSIAAARTVVHPGFEKCRVVIAEVCFLKQNECSGMCQKAFNLSALLTPAVTIRCL